MPIIHTQARRLYQCDCCGKTDVWGDTWAWYGSWRAMDDGDPLLTICSADCRVKMIADGKLPHEGIDDAGNVTEESEIAAPRRRTQRLSSQDRQP